MKNVSTKISILVVSVIVVVGAVLFFVRTVVSPPTKTEVINQHQQILENGVNSLSSSKGMLYNDSLYDALIDKIFVFESNKLISEAQADHDKSRLINSYIPLFKSKCLKDFQTSRWGESLFPPIRKRIGELRSVKLANKTSVVQGSNASDLREIEQVMTNYNEAKPISRIRSFRGVLTARNNITNAAKYASMDYIKVSNLKEGLSKVRSSIAESHYEYIVRKVHGLRSYRSITEIQFNSLVDSVNAAIKEYNSNKSMYGSDARDLSGLHSEAGTIISNARQYYASLIKPSITISSGGWQSWYDSSCPSCSSYRSYSNYHINDMKASMSFTIKGYENFSIQVKCSSETNYDYLLVGDAEQYNVTEQNNKWNSKGKDSNWYTVYYSGLSKSKSYTIYLVYRKDGSGNSGDDRAYVRLPKTN